MFRIMIIDDEESLRRLLRKIIDWRVLESEVVGEAGSGIEAINTMDELQPDIAIVDIQMPYMNGIEFSKLAMKRYPNLKIIILTAYNDFQYAKECVGTGISAFLVKPVSIDELNETLKTIIEQLKLVKKDESYGDEKIIKIHQFTKYIEDNYENSELNLTYLSQEFGFNPSYFSRKFKEETGFSFVDYLTSYRINKACEYAKNGELMYQTAALVGIPDPTYFGKCFKKYKKVSYSDYIKRYNYL